MTQSWVKNVPSVGLNIRVPHPSILSASLDAPRLACLGGEIYASMVARSKTHAKHNSARDEDGPFCPLCIEPLDADERNWLPCPCGYQVCAFCFGRLSLEDKNRCPGCRTEYGAYKVAESGSRGTHPYKQASNDLEISVQSDTSRPTPIPQLTSAIEPPGDPVNPSSAQEVVASHENTAPAVPLDYAKGSDDPSQDAADDITKVPQRQEDAFEEDEEPEQRPKIQPTKIKTRPWGIIDTGQKNVEAVQQSPSLAESAWPTLGAESQQMPEMQIPQLPTKNGQIPFHQVHNNNVNHQRVGSSEASERLVAFLGEIAQKKQQQQALIRQTQPHPIPGSRPLQDHNEPPSQSTQEPRPIRPPPGYDQPQHHWAQSSGQEPERAPAKPYMQPQNGQVDMQEKFARWLQTMNAGSRPQMPGQNSMPDGRPSSQWAADVAHASQTSLAPSDSVQDLVRQAADAHGAYSGTPPPGFNTEEQEKPLDPFFDGIPIERQSDLDASDKGLEKLYNIWPPNARSNNNDSVGPSSFNSTHNMWAIPNKQSSGMSSLWYPQNTENPIPNGLQELWDKPADQLSNQNRGDDTARQNQADMQGHQDSYHLSFPSHRQSDTQSESQLPQYASQALNIGSGMNRSQTQTPTQNGMLGNYSQGLGSRFFQGGNGNLGQGGLGTMSSGNNLANTNMGLGGTRNGTQNGVYGGQTGQQATQAYLQNLQLQAALKQQTPSTQQALLQAHQQARFNPQAQSRPNFPNQNVGLQGFNNNTTLPPNPAVSQQITQNLSNLTQGLGNLGNLNLTQAYANQLLGQLSLNSNQGNGGNTSFGAGNNLLGDLRNNRPGLQNQQFSLGQNQLFNGGNALGTSNQLGLNQNLNNGLGNGNSDVNALRLQQAIQALNLQQLQQSNNNSQQQQLQNLQNLQNQVILERQRKTLEAWGKQQQAQQAQQAFPQNPQNQGLRQEQSRFAGQFNGAQRSVAQNPFYQNLGGQAQTQSLQQQQHRLGRSGSPGFGQNNNLGNRMYQQ